MFMVCQNFSLINNCFVIFVPRSWYHDENSQSHYDPIHFCPRKKNPLNGMITTADLANWPQLSDTGPESLIHAETWLKVVYKRGSSVSRICNNSIVRLYWLEKLCSLDQMSCGLANAMLRIATVSLVYILFAQHCTAKLQKKVLVSRWSEHGGLMQTVNPDSFQRTENMISTWDICLPGKIVIGMVSILCILIVLVDN